MKLGGDVLRLLKKGENTGSRVWHRLKPSNGFYRDTMKKSIRLIKTNLNFSPAGLKLRNYIEIFGLISRE